MKFRIEDLTDGLVSESAQNERGGKFIQLTDGKEEVLVFSQMDRHPFHANIAEAFLHLIGEQGRYNHKRDHYFTEGTGWDVLGGGVWRLSDADHTLTLGGESMAYGPFIKNSLKKHIIGSKVLNGYKVVFR